MQQDYGTFLKRFAFDTDKRGCVGVESELFVVNYDGFPVPVADRVLGKLGGNFTYELSRCQIEHRSSPCSDMLELKHQQISNVNLAVIAASKEGVTVKALEVAPENMPLDIYPDNRYIKCVVPKLSNEQLSAACRVAGTHVHIGTASMDEAIRVYNRLAAAWRQLAEMGDHSGGERLKLYRQVAGECEPPHIEDANHFFEMASAQGFVQNPRNCWWFVRISRYGTVETRVFGTSPHADEIVLWASAIRSMAQEVM